MVDRFPGLGVGKLCNTPAFGLGRGFDRASGEEATWWRSGCALRGRLGEKETRRRASVILGRGVSESEAEDELEEWRGEWMWEGCDPNGGA